MANVLIILIYLYASLSASARAVLDAPRLLTIHCSFQCKVKSEIYWMFSTGQPFENWIGIVLEFRQGVR